jgi:hypothetical protein
VVEDELRRELKAHLRRLAVWSWLWLAVLAIASVAGAVDFTRLGQGDYRTSAFDLDMFLVVSAAWSAVNLGIVGLAARDRRPLRLQRLREILWFNQGLNLLYVVVGVVLARFAFAGPWSGAGPPVALQGLALLALDGWLLFRLPADEAQG